MPQADCSVVSCFVCGVMDGGRSEMVGASATVRVVLDAMLADVEGLKVGTLLRQERFETILFLAAGNAVKTDRLAGAGGRRR